MPSGEKLQILVIITKMLLFTVKTKLYMYIMSIYGRTGVMSGSFGGGYMELSSVYLYTLILISLEK